MPKFIYYLYFIPLLVGAMVSWRTFKTSWPRFFQLFSLFLTGTLLMELFAVSWKFWLHKTGWWSLPKSNLWIYNLYYIPQYLLYYIFLYKATGEEKPPKKVFQAICLLTIVGGLCNLLFIQGLQMLDTYTIIIGSLGVIFFCLNYLRLESWQFDQRKPVRDPGLWIVAGALLFHLAALPYFVCINYLSGSNIKLALTLFTIILFLNILMYSMYLIAFLCGRPFPQKPSSRS